jgi:hypothetical protein
MCVEAGGWWQNAENRPTRALFQKNVDKVRGVPLTVRILQNLSGNPIISMQ